MSNLGDSAADLAGQACANTTVACGAQSADQHRQLDAVITAEEQADGKYEFGGNACVGRGPARVTPELVRQQAIRLIPTAAVGVAPKGTSLVNMETVLWADAPRQRALAPVTILGQRVTIRIVLDHVAWNFGDGKTDGDGPAGKPYDDRRDPCHEKNCADYYGHTYVHTGTIQVSAQASWHASFSVGGGAPVDIPGTVDGPANSARIVIKQARAVLVQDP